MQRFVALALVLLFAVSCNDDPPRAAPTPPPPRLIPPLHDAKVGEWLRVEAGRDAQVFRVVDAGDYSVDVETTTYKEQAPVGVPHKTRWWRNSFGLPEDECVVRALDPDRIQVGDKWYECWRIYVTSRNGQERYVWVSEEIPVHGVLKVAAINKGVTDERNAVTLAEWGVGE
jgi:hypothetical protein